MEVRLSLFKWNKVGRVFDPSQVDEEHWICEFAQSPSVIVDQNRVRVFFCSRPNRCQDGQYLSYMAYADLDRQNLLEVVQVCRRPLLELGDTGTFDEFGTYPVSVVRDGAQLWAYYAGWTRCASVPFNASIGLAVSSNGGESFTRLGPGPVLSHSSEEPFLLGSPRVRRFNNQWQLWYVAGREWRLVSDKPEPIYKIRMATSTNGIDWERLGQDLISDLLGDHECQACPDVTYRDGKYHMFFCYRDIRNYKNASGGYRIGYAWSEDMFVWHREDHMTHIELSDSGWDSEMINYPHIFELDGKSYMLYQGNEMGRSGFGLAVLDAEQAWGC